jgi:hypothetical protein
MTAMSSSMEVQAPLCGGVDGLHGGDVAWHGLV